MQKLSRTVGKVPVQHFISGGTGSGKTTFLNALSQAIPPEERIVTIEDSAELQLKYAQNLVSLETRNANMEGCRTISVRDLIRSSLRMRPDSLMMKKRKSKHNKRVSPSHAASRMTRLAISFFSSIVKLSKLAKSASISVRLFSAFFRAAAFRLFPGRASPLPFSTSEARRPASRSRPRYTSRRRTVPTWPVCR